jgi:chromosome segregation ATPase
MLRARGATTFVPRFQLIQQSSTYLSTFQQQGSATMNQRTAYIEKMELQLDKLNKKMVGLETSAQEAKEEARQTYKDEMGKLRHQSNVAVAKLDQLKAASVDSWQELVTDMEKMHDAFTHSIFSLFQVPIPSSPKTDAEKKDGSTPHTKKG